MKLKNEIELLENHLITLVPYFYLSFYYLSFS